MVTYGCFIITIVRPIKVIFFWYWTRKKYNGKKFITLEIITTGVEGSDIMNIQFNCSSTYSNRNGSLNKICFGITVWCRIGRWFLWTLSTSNYYVLLLVEEQLLLWNEYLFVSDSYGIHLFRTILFNWLIHSYPLMICWDTFAFENVFFFKKKRGFLVYNEYRFFKCISFQSWYIICFETINNVCFETNVLGL